MARVTEMLKAFNDVGLGWKIALAASALFGIGAAAAPYVDLPARVKIIEVVHDSLGHRFDRMEDDVSQTNCVVIALADRRSHVPCLRVKR